MKRISVQTCFGLDLKYMGAQEVDNLNLSMTSEFQQFTVIINMVLKRAKCDLNGVKIAFFATKLQKSPSSWELCPLCDTLELHRFVQHGTYSKLENF